MFFYEAALLLSAGYLGVYGAFCICRGGAGAGALILTALPLFLFVTLVCIS